MRWFSVGDPWARARVLVAIALLVGLVALGLSAGGHRAVAAFIGACIVGAGMLVQVVARSRSVSEACAVVDLVVTGAVAATYLFDLSVAPMAVVLVALAETIIVLSARVSFLAVLGAVAALATRVFWSVTQGYLPEHPSRIIAVGGGACVLGCIWCMRCQATARTGVERVSVPSRRRDGPAQRGVAPGSLSPRELEVMELMCEGLSYRAIAQRLFISPGTARAHGAAIMRKLGVHSRAEVVELAGHAPVRGTPSTPLGQRPRS